MRRARASRDVITVCLLAFLCFGFTVYYVDIVHRRGIAEADRKLNHAENQEILRLLKAQR